MAAQHDTDPRIAFMMRALETPPVAYKLAGLLAWKYGSKNGAIFPAQETLAGELGVTARYVRRVLKKELVPLGLKIAIRRGPRIGTTMSYYSFGDPNPDSTPIPELRNLNTKLNSGTQKPKSAPYSGTGTTSIPELQVQNSGTAVPPNQKNQPTGGSNRESTQARAAHARVGEGFENLEAKNGEVIQPAKRTGKPTPLPPGWQPDDQGRACAEQHGLTGDNLGREVTAFQNHCADKGRLSCDWSAAWCGFVDKTRLGSVGGVRFKSRGDRARELARQVEARERAEAEAKARGPP